MNQADLKVRSGVPAYAVVLPPLLLLLLAAAAPADPPAALPEKPAASPVDARKMAEALANRNPLPRLAKSMEGRDPVFPQDFNWSEDARAWLALRSLIEHAEAAWPGMVRHLDDGRYCITVDEALSCEYALNWTVGDACREIIAGALTQGYLRHLRMDKVSYWRLARSDLTRDAKKLQAWCASRSGRPLYELQIEICQAALADVQHGAWPPRVTPERRRDWAAALKADVASLRASRKAYQFQGFGESYHPYSFKEIEAYRKMCGKRKEGDRRPGTGGGGQ